MKLVGHSRPSGLALCVGRIEEQDVTFACQQRFF
jgi:hypothetical protein